MPRSKHRERQGEEARWLVPREWQEVGDRLRWLADRIEEDGRGRMTAHNEADYLRHIANRLDEPPVRAETVADRREVFSRAIVNRLPVAFDYPAKGHRDDRCDPAAIDYEPRLLWPHHEDERVFGGYDYDRDAYRSFRLDRARNVRVHTEGSEG